MVDVCRPRPVEGDESASIDRPAEDIFWNEDAFIPQQDLTGPRGVCSVFAFAYPLKPIPIRVVSVFEPFIDEKIRRVAIEGLADEL